MYVLSLQEVGTSYKISGCTVPYCISFSSSLDILNIDDAEYSFRSQNW
jgi:hypothetical protein